MMPLLLAPVGESNMVRHIGGTPEVRRHLEDLGFVAGATVTIISRIGGNVIVKVKESRLAIDEKMAQKIMV
ncbi:MAG: ferrous iron transport protein A [Clostridia bacterium]|nr:ferrous iron transport protein A [Clostridia bacterium]